MGRHPAGYPVVDVKVELIDGSFTRRLERAGLQDRCPIAFKKP
jgi:hypothetical protein